MDSDTHSSSSIKLKSAEQQALAEGCIDSLRVTPSTHLSPSTNQPAGIGEFVGGSVGSGVGAAVVGELVG